MAKPPIFSAAVIEDSIEDSHSITTDDKYFKKLGLSAFTTGIFYDWLHRTDSGPKPVSYYGEDGQNISGDSDTADLEGKLFSCKNLNLFIHKFSVEGKYEATEDVTISDKVKGMNPPELFFSLNNAAGETLRDNTCPEEDDPVDKTNGTFLAWRNEGRNGKYYEFSLSNVLGNPYWEFKEGDENWTWEDLEIDDFDPTTIWERHQDSSPDQTPDFHYKYNILMNLNPKPESETPVLESIIKMNDYVNNTFKGEWDQDKWNLEQGEDKAWSIKDKARFRFINDIKASKNHCLEYKSDIYFTLDLTKNVKGEGEKLGKICVGQSLVTFKLYFYDNAEKKDSGRYLANASNTMVAAKKTNYGREYKNRVDAETDEGEVGKVAGDLDMNYVELEGKFESGTTQIVAVLLEDLPPATQPNLNDIETQDASFLLSSVTGFGPSIGYAVPINMQNANPMQWMPDFDSPTESCEGAEKSNKKVVVQVYNITTANFKAGENVILQKIEGVWVPLLTASSPDTALTPADPKWDFTYLMTNSMFFFRNHDWIIRDSFAGGYGATKSTPDNYEKSFYRWYYSKPEPNITDFDTTITDNSERYPATVDPYARVFNGYMQVTSFDFMGIAMGGARRQNHNKDRSYQDSIVSEIDAVNEGYLGDTATNGNALSCTQFGRDQDTILLEEPRRANSYPFFGCVFPDGYNMINEEHKDKYAELVKRTGKESDERDFFLTPKNYEAFENHTSKTPFFYATALPPFTNNNNVRANDAKDSDHQDLGMFHNEFGELKHLPADIGTNASPSGKYGSPISNIGIIGEMNNHADSLGFRDVVDSYLDKTNVGQRKYLSWMHKKEMEYDGLTETFTETEDGTSEKVSKYTGETIYEDDAFDLTPADPLKIEFRPLIQEVYSSFEGYTFGKQGNEYGFYLSEITEFSYVSNYDHTKAGGGGIGDYGQFAREGYEFTKAHYNENFTNGGLTPSLSPYSLFRNPQIIKKPDIKFHPDAKGTYYRAQIGDFDEYTLLQRGADSRSVKNAGGLRYNWNLVKQHRSQASSSNSDGSTDLHNLKGDWSHAPQLWDWEDKDVPAGGIGIIGAIVTVAARGTIEFNTENAIGIDDYFIEGPNDTIEYPQSWKGGDFSTMNTTQLYAKVYQQWPRDQMIYDPRFFVVHHFNERGKGTNWGDWKEPRWEYDEMAGLIYEGASGVDILDSVVDYRVPTYWDKSVVTPSDFLVRFLDVYSNSTEETLPKGETMCEEGDISEGVTKLRSTEHWNVVTKRRGKLLPYSYKIESTIGINKEPVIEILLGRTEGESFELSADNQDILILNQGHGYTEDSLFTANLPGGQGVILKARIDGDGKIIGFIVDNTGFGFSPASFMRSNQTIRIVWDVDAAGKNTGYKSLVSFAGVKIVPNDSSLGGVGFEGYICRGAIVEGPTQTDEKPLQALGTKGEIKLTPNPQGSSDKEFELQVTEKAGESFLIDSAAKTENDEYDVFLHFHNDISHSRMHATERPDAVEQMVRLKIKTGVSV